MVQPTLSTTTIAQTIPSVSMVKSSQVQPNQSNFVNQNKANPIVRLNDIQKTLVNETIISSSTQATETIIIPQW